MQSLYVGIDVGSRTNAAYLMLPDGAKHSSFAVQNDRNGAVMLSQKVAEALVQTSLPGVVLGIEATSVYGDNLVRF